MRVFDFDNTIYDGESTFDFAIFIMKKKKSLFRFLPAFLWLLFLYKICKMNVKSFQKRLEKYTQSFLANKEFVLECVQEFWDENIEKLYPNMLKMIRREDIIITTCPRFLIQGIQDVIHTDHILATELDIENGKIKYLNFQENKVKNFKKNYPKVTIKDFYTDSFNDQPLMDISTNVFLVRNGVYKKIK